ncbi:MAG: helix-turn-helix domain-containing protein [Candidatus Aenigmatarchaeota archaeon]
MLDKYFLINRIVKSLIKRNFKVFVSEGSFDIAARRDKVLLLKILLNVDALEREQALTLLSISHFISAFPFVISEKTNKGFLKKGIIYSRFGLPVINSQTFDEILEEEIYLIHAAKGRYVMEIDVEKLRRTREELGYSLSELSKLVGVSKKTLYEIEKKRVNPSEKTLEKLEKILNTRLILPFRPKVPEELKLKPKDNFQKQVMEEFTRIGIDNSATYSTLFDIVGKEKFSLIIGLAKGRLNLKRKAQNVKKISKIFDSKAFFVGRAVNKEIIEGLPLILEEELSEIQNVNEFNKILEEKQA